MLCITTYFLTCQILYTSTLSIRHNLCNLASVAGNFLHFCKDIINFPHITLKQLCHIAHTSKGRFLDILGNHLTILGQIVNNAPDKVNLLKVQAVLLREMKDELVKTETKGKANTYRLA